ncbi:MAG: hypothetical protein LC777_16455 [Actinobacteria bacterium]|nr:hypothetical protein [Actinomycetota bacterium]
MTTGDWMRGNLTAQGYCLSDAERRERVMIAFLVGGAALDKALITLDASVALPAMLSPSGVPRKLLVPPRVRCGPLPRRAPTSRAGPAH